MAGSLEQRIACVGSLDLVGSAMVRDSVAGAALAGAMEITE